MIFKRSRTGWTALVETLVYFIIEVSSLRKRLVMSSETSRYVVTYTTVKFCFSKSTRVEKSEIRFEDSI